MGDWRGMRFSRTGRVDSAGLSTDIVSSDGVVPAELVVIGMSIDDAVDVVEMSEEVESRSKVSRRESPG